MLLCFPVVGLGVFSVFAPVRSSEESLHLDAMGVRATGAETAEGFVVRAGSHARKAEVPSCPASVIQLRAALVANGALIAGGEGYAFAQDYVFQSPSTAACVVLGRSANGRVEWKTKEGKTLKQVQEAAAAS
jgi:hypothetical protein